MADRITSEIMKLIDERADRIRKMVDFLERQRRVLIVTFLVAAILGLVVVLGTLLWSLQYSETSYQYKQTYVIYAFMFSLTLGAISAVFYGLFGYRPSMNRSLRQEIIITKRLVGRASVLRDSPVLDSDEQFILDIRLGEVEALLSWAEDLAARPGAQKS